MWKRGDGSVGGRRKGNNGGGKLCGVGEEADKVGWGSGEQYAGYVGELFGSNGVDVRCEE